MVPGIKGEVLPGSGDHWGGKRAGKKKNKLKKALGCLTARRQTRYVCGEKTPRILRTGGEKGEKRGAARCGHEFLAIRRKTLKGIWQNEKKSIARVGEKKRGIKRPPRGQCCIKNANCVPSCSAGKETRGLEIGWRRSRDTAGKTA